MTDEQIIAAAGEPVAYQHRDGMLSCRLPGGGIVGIDWTFLYTADAILSAVKPLRDRIVELEAEVEQWMTVTPTADDAVALADQVIDLTQQNAELAKQVSDYEQANTDVHKWRNNYRREIAKLLTQRDSLFGALVQLNSASNFIDRLKASGIADAAIASVKDAA